MKNKWKERVGIRVKIEVRSNLAANIPPTLTILIVGKYPNLAILKLKWSGNLLNLGKVWSAELATFSMLSPISYWSLECQSFIESRIGLESEILE